MPSKKTHFILKDATCKYKYKRRYNIATIKKRSVVVILTSDKIYLRKTNAARDKEGHFYNDKRANQSKIYKNCKHIST